MKCANTYYADQHDREQIKLEREQEIIDTRIVAERNRLMYSTAGIDELIAEANRDIELAAALANCCRYLALPESANAPACFHALERRIYQLADKQAELNVDPGECALLDEQAG